MKKKKNHKLSNKWK